MTCAIPWGPSLLAMNDDAVDLWPRCACIASKLGSHSYLHEAGRGFSQEDTRRFTTSLLSEMPPSRLKPVLRNLCTSSS
jgi:hypothetical protein